MVANSKNGTDSAEVWERAVRLNDFSPTAARALLKLQFSPEDIGRMRELSAKATQGTLTESEDTEMDTFERLGILLDILHSKARCLLGIRPKR